jgi:hypothetical protein
MEGLLVLATHLKVETGAPAVTDKPVGATQLGGAVMFKV